MRLEWMEKYMADAEKLIYENKVEEGLRLLDGLLYEEPGYGSLHNHLGWAYFYYTPETERAEMHLKMAIRFAPDYAPPYQHLGTLYLRMDRYAEALEYFERGVTKHQANRTAFLDGIGQVYELKREYRKAIKAYKEALASTVGFESINLGESIKRCQKKRWVMMFNL